MSTPLEPFDFEKFKPHREQKETDGQMAILSRAGDTKVIWDPDNEDEVAAASEQFKKLRKRGFLAFKVGKNGEKDEMITEFNPRAGMIILCPAIKGGAQ